ncbi:hypothetical protein GCM10028773_59350 [Spirosoma koreense]
MRIEVRDTGASAGFYNFEFLIPKLVIIMRQAIHFLRKHWAKLIHWLLPDRNKAQWQQISTDRQNLPVGELYYSTLVRNYRGYIYKGQILHSRATKPV